MRSRSFAVLAALAIAAAPAAAQTPTQDDFRFLNLHAGAPNIDGAYIGPYIGSFDGTPGPVSNGVFSTPFDVWCVDYVHHITYGDTYDAWITPMDGSDFSHTRMGAADKTDYQWTAYFAGLMDWTVPGHAADGARDASLQDIMWVLMGGNTPTLQGSGQTRSQFLTAFAGSTLGTSLGLNTVAAAHSNWYDFTPTGNYAVFSDWSIITCDAGSNQAASACPFQEFIFRDGLDTPSDVTPEPVTMTLLGTGLAGMAAAGRKRRRKTA